MLFERILARLFHVGFLVYLVLLTEAARYSLFNIRLSFVGTFLMFSSLFLSYLVITGPQVVPRVVQATGSVHPQPTLPNGECERKQKRLNIL